MFADGLLDEIINIYRDIYKANALVWESLFEAFGIPRMPNSKIWV